MSDDATPSKTSHWLGWLAELLKNWFAPIVVGAVAFLLYPFDWAACLSAALLILGCILMMRRARHVRRARRSSWLWWTGSVIAGCLALSWVAVWPAIGVRPIYICDSLKTYWTGTSFEPLTANGRQVASLLFVTDPIRKSQVFHEVARWLAGRRLREIRAAGDGQQQYYEMPLIFALRKSVPTPSSSIEQDDLTEVVYQGLSVGVGVTIIKDSLLIKEGVGITHGPIVISADRRSEPWQIVAVRTSEKEVARYAARVDFALTAVDSGDYSTALALLEDAGAHAPSTLERARSLVLMGQLASMMLNDSIGDLQALSLYHEAFRVWHDVVSTSATQGEVKTPLEQWIRDELSAEFEQYGTAYPEVASALALDPKAVRAAEALRFQKERGEPVANSPEVTAMLNSVSRRFRQYVSSDNAQTWFDAERERLARLDSKSLIEEAKQAVSRGPDEARWFAETLTIIYAGGVGDAEDHRVSMALTTASDGCTEPWRSQFKEYLRASARNLKTMRPSSDVSQEQVELTLESAHRFGLEKTAQVFQAVLATARSQNSPPTAEPLLAGPPPSAAWWTSEYLDWFLATMWNVVSHSHAECDVPSQSCQDMLMRVRPYICFDGSEKHRLFLPGLGVAKWMLLGEPKVDPYWDHAFYFGTGTHFALWQRGL